MYDLAILGGGPAGVSAGIYASRKNLKTVLISDKLAGQSIISPDIQNWVGAVSISGEKLAKDMENHLRAYANDVVDIKTNEKVILVKKENGIFFIQTNKNIYEAKTILVTTGKHRRKLDVIGAKEFENKGITYCATCDGPLFKGKDVAVIGGGNAGFETASQLLEYTKSVTLLQNGDIFRADDVTVKKVSVNSKMKALLNAKLLEIKGDDFVKALVYKNTKTEEVVELQVEGIFVEIGAVPTTEFLTGLFELDKYNAIVVDPRTQRASIDGVWAAGDCTDALYHQNNISVGDGVKALEDIYLYLRVK